MLVVEREVNQQIIVGKPDGTTVLTRPVVITIVRARNGKVHVGIEAAAAVPIDRREIYELKFGVAVVTSATRQGGRVHRRARKRARSA